MFFRFFFLKGRKWKSRLVKRIRGRRRCWRGGGGVPVEVCGGATQRVHRVLEGLKGGGKMAVRVVKNLSVDGGVKRR